MRNIRVAGARDRRDKGRESEGLMALRDWFWILVLGISWGGAFFFNEILLRELGPLWIGAGRVGVGAAATWVFLIATGRLVALPGRTLGQLSVHGMLMFGAPLTIFPIGQQATTSGAAGVVNAMTPIMVVIVSHLWPGGERATPIKTAGVMLGFLGILMLSIPALRGEGDSRLWGLLFLLAAPLSYGLALNYVRRLAGLDPVIMLAWALSFAALGVGAVALVFEGEPGMLSLAGWGALLATGVALTSVAFLIFFTLLPRVGATNLSTVTFIAPVSAVFLGVAFLGESLGVWKIAGMVGIFAGLLLIDGRILQWLGIGSKDQPTG